MVSLSYLYAGTQVAAGFPAVAGSLSLLTFLLLLIAGVPFCCSHLQLFLRVSPAVCKSVVCAESFKGFARVQSCDKWGRGKKYICGIRILLYQKSRNSAGYREIRYILVNEKYSAEFWALSYYIRNMRN